MNKTLTSLLTAGAITLAGCATTDGATKSKSASKAKARSIKNISSEYNTAEWNIKDNDLGIVNSEESPYTLSVIGLDNESFYVGRGNHTNLQGTLEFLLYPVEKTSLKINDETRAVTIQPEVVGLPTLATNSNGKPYTQATLDLEATNSITSSKLIDTLAITNFTQNSVVYSIPTININRVGFYHARNGTNSTLIPTYGTSRIISPTGEITLENPNGFYNVNFMPIQNYNALIAPVPTTANPVISTNKPIKIKGMQ